jgi:hypothetical protein
MKANFLWKFIRLLVSICVLLLQNRYSPDNQCYIFAHLLFAFYFSKKIEIQKNLSAIKELLQGKKCRPVRNPKQ